MLDIIYMELIVDLDFKILYKNYVENLWESTSKNEYKIMIFVSFIGYIYDLYILFIG